MVKVPPPDTNDSEREEKYGPR